MFSRTPGVDDLCLVSSPSHSNLTSELEKRFDRSLIYTNIGDVLIAVNPYTQLPIYTDQHIMMYQNSSMSGSPPHIFALAESAYRRLVSDRESQAVIISGESGAGKTESAKLILNYVSSVSGDSGESQRIKQIISDTNPILESFGNAKTIRNDNSSRFGKYLEIFFNDRGEPVGGMVTNFLLEKTRVGQLGRGERNYHIFYYLCAGANAQMRQEFALDVAQNYAYLNAGQVTTVEGKDDAVLFQEVDHALYTIGVTEQEKWGIYKILAGILHLGNIQFQDQGDPPAQPTDPNAIQWAAYLFGMDQNALLQSINHRMITTGGRSSVYYVPQNARQSTQIRDALAKEMYSRVFDFLVHRINQVLAPRSQVVNLIGILDIYGFEVFEHNSFEQFCINYVNEKLQQIFIDLTIREEQKEYHDQGLKWKDIAFFDNKTVCDLIDGRNPPGLMRLLDDVCRTAHSVEKEKADAKFCEDIYKGIQHKHLIVQFPNFTIKHYAGDVTYDTNDFCFKNNDNLFTSLIASVQTTNDQFIRSLWPEDVSNNKQAPTTSSTKIRNSAAELVKKLRNCAGHYVRCIKPNDRKAAMTFNSSRVQHQVKYLGLLDNVKVKRSGFAYRHFYEVFLNRFACMMDTPLQYGGPDGCKQLIDFLCASYKDIPKDQFCFGTTKIFIRDPETLFQLEEHRFQKMEPEAYAEKVRAFEESERAAKRAQGASYGQKRKCLIS